MMEPYEREVTIGACEAAAERHAFADWARACGVADEQVADWALVFSELLTNACAASPVGSTVRLDAFVDDRVVLTVANSSATTIPRVHQHAPPDQATGRGLLIAARLSNHLSFVVDHDEVRVVCWRYLQQRTGGGRRPAVVLA